ncbi:MAG: 1-acyl-sn-glycerol-3-phosphate acyltransferase [Pseudomonadota bacterium]
MRRFIDRTVGRWVRHFFFLCLRSYYGLFFNVGVSGKHLLQAEPGSLILATHVSRHDGPLIATMLYSTVRVRPTVHWDEYHHPAQRFPMWVASAIPMSSPKDWPKERREAQKAKTLSIIHKVLGNDNAVLVFPAGRIRQQPEEIVAPYLNGVREILTHQPDTPVLLLRTEGLGRFQDKSHDRFWSFIGRKKGRRHVNMTLSPVTDLDPSIPREDFNAQLEEMLNRPVAH